MICSVQRQSDASIDADMVGQYNCSAIIILYNTRDFIMSKLLLVRSENFCEKKKEIYFSRIRTKLYKNN